MYDQTFYSKHVLAFHMPSSVKIHWNVLQVYSCKALFKRDCKSVQVFTNLTCDHMCSNGPQVGASFLYFFLSSLLVCFSTTHFRFLCLNNYFQHFGKSITCLSLQFLFKREKLARTCASFLSTFKVIASLRKSVQVGVQTTTQVKLAKTCTDLQSRLNRA